MLRSDEMPRENQCMLLCIDAGWPFREEQADDGKEFMVVQARMGSSRTGLLAVPPRDPTGR